MEKSSNRHMLLLILKTPMVFETITEVLGELKVDSIVLKGSQITSAEEAQKLEVPMVGGFMRLLEKDAPESKAVLTVMEDSKLQRFEERCQSIYGDFTDHKDLMAFVLPVIRTLGSQLKFAG